jgi:RNA polymerase sigma-70 factor (ECF subfamily)
VSRSVHPLSSPGFDALRCAVAEVILDSRFTMSSTPPRPVSDSSGRPGDYPPGDDETAQRIAALVDLARDGDADAFGQLYDHYSAGVYRFIYYRVSTQALAEDLTSETFFRALRSMASFQWQGKDFGAWLTTIARNLVVDHYKAGRTRLETSTDDFSDRTEVAAGPEEEVLANLTNEVLHAAMQKLPSEQQECLVLRFLNGSSIAETAKALGRSEGAIKQLQLRAVRNLAKLLPEGVR